METTLATLIAGRVLELIARFLHERPRHPHARRHNFYARRHSFGSAQVLTGDQIDSIWLQRVELRSPRQIGEVLEQSGFAFRKGAMSAIFVDEKCGFICAETIDLKRHRDIACAAHSILRRASNYHANALILATNDLSGRPISSGKFNDLLLKLYHTGDAINVPLLDHVSLTATGWHSRLTPGAERLEA